MFNADESLISEREDKLFINRLGAKGRAAGLTRGERGKTVGSMTPFVSATGSILPKIVWRNNCAFLKLKTIC